jgi:hypothetical protein
MMDRDKFQNWKNGVTDRRKWERHPPTKGTIALLNGRSYRMMDISFGGMSIYDYGGETVSEETIVELHCFEEGLFSSAIRCRKVSDNRVVSYTQYGKAVLNRIGLQIVESDPDLEQKLEPFLGSLYMENP